MGTEARDLIGYTVTISATDPTLDRYLDRLYGGFPPAVRATHALTIGPGPAGDMELREDDEPVGRAASGEGLVAALVGHVNRTVAEVSPHVLVHAGGVEHAARGLILPAAMESGKSTLTAGLVRAGLRYLTDEAIALDRTTHHIVPYPKPITLDPGSWHLFPELEPHEPFPTDEYRAHQWHVPPTAVRPDAVGASCPARYVVFPRYEAGTTTALVPLRRAEALVELARNTFRFDREGRPTFEVLGAVVREAEVFRLAYGDLDAALDAITGLVAE